MVFSMVGKGDESRHLSEARLELSHDGVGDHDYIRDFPDDILLRGEYQQISWSLSHPGYTVVFPEPGIGKDLFGYATAQDADKFLNYLNLWLDLKKNEQLTDQQFDIWVLGYTDITTAPVRRWSIIRDVFGWTEN
jgi:hypothetical protein